MVKRRHGLSLRGSPGILERTGRAGGMRMKWMVLCFALGVAAVASADEFNGRCTYKWVFYPPGGTTCQDGKQAKCVAGRWQPTGEGCADAAGDPTGEETAPGVAKPRVKDPRV